MLPGPVLLLLQRCGRWTCWAAGGEEDAPVGALAGALAVACLQGYVRAFAPRGHVISALLARLVAARKADHAVARGIPLGCLAQALQAFGGKGGMQGAGPDAAAAVPGLVEQLAACELEVLALLAAGTPEPAHRRGSDSRPRHSEKHVSHLLGRLGAANRTEAVTRAHQLGPIP